MIVTSWDYIIENFRAEDCLAVVIRNSDWVIEQVVTAEQLASRSFHVWLRHENDHGGNIYISMNPLKPGARGRTRQDVAVVRHICLDLDQGGTSTLLRILADTQLPAPSYVLRTSIGRFQVVWRVEGFGIPDAEHLQRALSLKHDTDCAATDVTSLLRIPGFYNWKYTPPHLVCAVRVSNPIYCPSNFSVESHLYVVPKPQIPGSRTTKGSGRPV